MDRVGGWVGETYLDLAVSLSFHHLGFVPHVVVFAEDVHPVARLEGGEVVTMGGWVGDGKVEKIKAVRMRCCELGVRVGGWVVYLNLSVASSSSSHASSAASQEASVGRQLGG